MEDIINCYKISFEPSIEGSLEEAVVKKNAQLLSNIAERDENYRKLAFLSQMYNAGIYGSVFMDDVLSLHSVSKLVQFGWSVVADLRANKYKYIKDIQDIMKHVEKCRKLVYEIVDSISKELLKEGFLDNSEQLSSLLDEIYVFSKRVIHFSYLKSFPVAEEFESEIKHTFLVSFIDYQSGENWLMEWDAAGPIIWQSHMEKICKISQFAFATVAETLFRLIVKSQDENAVEFSSNVQEIKQIMLHMEDVENQKNSYMNHQLQSDTNDNNIHNNEIDIKFTREYRLLQESRKVRNRIKSLEALIISIEKNVEQTTSKSNDAVERNQYNEVESKITEFKNELDKFLLAYAFIHEAKRTQNVPVSPPENNVTQEDIPVINEDSVETPVNPDDEQIFVLDYFKDSEDEGTVEEEFANPDEFFESRGGMLDHEENLDVETEMQSASKLAIGLVMTELKANLTEVREKMNTREKIAKKSHCGDDEEESLSDAGPSKHVEKENYIPVVKDRQNMNRREMADFKAMRSLNYATPSTAGYVSEVLKSNNSVASDDNVEKQLSLVELMNAVKISRGYLPSSDEEEFAG